VPVTVPDVAALLGLAAVEELDDEALEELAELELLDEVEPSAVGALVVPLAVVLPLYGVLAEELPPAAAAVDDVEVW
jgi:hypothetical protein